MCVASDVACNFPCFAWNFLSELVRSACVRKEIDAVPVKELWMNQLIAEVQPARRVRVAFVGYTRSY